MKIPFSKYSGSGNDFILIDNRRGTFSPNSPLIKRLCKRRTGIGADGIILLESSHQADFKMCIFNADGSEAEMCGNGVRCLLKFIVALGFNKQNYLIETKETKITLSHVQGSPCVSMPTPSDLRLEIRLNVDDEVFPIHFINTGVPHAVLTVDDLELAHWMNIAPKIRRHPEFDPHGTNVNFIKLDEQGKVHIRTYERGVEDETLACGTGATAAALIASALYHLPSPIQVIPRSHETLTINFVHSNLKFNQVSLSGPAALIFQGELVLD
jgi:diaminopimelate epimerase